MSRLAVGAVFVRESEIITTDPIIVAASRINSFDDGFAVVAFAHRVTRQPLICVLETGGTFTLSSVFGWNSAFGDPFHKGGGERRCGAKIKILEGHQRHGNRWDAEERRFHRRRNGNGVKNIVFQIGPLLIPEITRLGRTGNSFLSYFQGSERFGLNSIIV